MGSSRTPPDVIRPRHHLRNVLLAVLLSACSTLPRDAGAPAGQGPWEGWARAFDRAMSACLAEQGTDCLPRAFAEPRPALPDDPSASDVLYRDLRTAEILLGQEEAAALLAREYNIDPAAYLGTGYSVPVTGPGAYDYEHATQREYFVPNLCGDPAFCEPTDPGIWIWKLSPAEVTPWLARKLGDLARDVPPVADAAGLRDAVAAGGAAPGAGPLLVRFAIFDAANYRGTIGRPGTERVFFADYGRVRDETLRNALVGTGATGLVALAQGEADPEQTFFMWIHRPADAAAVRPATWDALFDAIEARRLAELAARP